MPMRRTYLVSLCLLLEPAAATSSVAQSVDPDNCLLCHQFRGLSRFDRQRDELHVYFVDPSYMHDLAGPHARLACTDCHPREEVRVVPHAPVSRVDCTRTCHIAGASGVMTTFSHAGVAEALRGGVHDPAIMRGLPLSEGPLLAQDQSACLYCHDEPVFRGIERALPQLARFGDDALARCTTCHKDQLGVDVAYALKHVAARLQPSRSTLDVAQVCAVCHSDPAFHAEPGRHDAVASYMRTFHGKAALLGDESTASCISCHASGNRDVHAMLAHTDPASPTHTDRLPTTCSTIACHPGASPSLADTGVHLDLAASRGTIEYLLAAAFILLTTLTFGPSAILAVLELVQLVAGRESPRDEHVRELTDRLMARPDGRRRLVRFTVPQRIQHWILAGLFVLLVLTGFPLKFADQGWSAWLIRGFGGLAAARALHHWAGILLVLGFLSHMMHTMLLVVRRSRRPGLDGRPTGMLASLLALPMWMTLDDLRKLRHLLAYLFFLRSDRPKFGRFALKEKFEYIGVFWGTMILGVTGMILWGEQTASHLMSGRVFNLAAIAHTYEAFLALVHVGILHTYNVMLSPHVFPLSPATITGTTPPGELIEGHAAFVEDAARELGLHPHEEGGAP
ncbi:MAG: hypothetical protein HS102_14265 [Planctomycetia bacterium]|nr:MAG: hypothetical protein F9K17_05835 [Phycisphaerae bacterium]MBE7457768.1 hypothetical protein [Planctomycetia bacterium]